jgi:DMSO/TMAO reductase YedYZ molybdopterin-dependent catalytic subunit
MSILVSRRNLIVALGSTALVGCDDASKWMPPNVRGGAVGLSDILTMSTHRLLQSKQQLVREYSLQDITKNFPVQGTAKPEEEPYEALLRGGFRDYRLPISGLVSNPMSLSIEEIRRMPSRTQITQHNCEQGWSAIAQWTGAPLTEVLKPAGVSAEARYVIFQTVDGWYEAVDMFDVVHPQTILAYGMNGKELPVQHGAPLRLRVERHVGYRQLKYVKSIHVVRSVDDYRAGGEEDWHFRDDWHADLHKNEGKGARCKGSVSADLDWHWYGGA